VNSAVDTLHIAMADGEDTALTDAIMSQWQAGVDVELAIDFDDAADPGMVALIDAGTLITDPVTDAGIERNGLTIRLNDASIGYFDFALNTDVAWPSTDIQMTQSFVVSDRLNMTAASRGGSMDTGTRIILDARGEELVEDVLAEHLQLFGGADSTAMTAFNAQQKSVVDTRWMYPGASDSIVEMWLGPQERLTKRMIDAVYGARSSVWIMTNEFANDGFAKALQDKAEWKTGDGTPFFDVRVIVGPNFGQATPTQSQQLENNTPDVRKRQVTDERVPTIMLIDVELDPDSPIGSIDSRLAPRGFVLTHDIFSSARIYKGRTVINDQLMDGTLWVIDDWESRSAELDTLVNVFDDHWERGDTL